MAQPTPPYPARVFSPPQSSATSEPASAGGQPAAKRPRLSPDAPSSYGSSNMANISLPNQAFTGPYYGSQTNGISTSQSFGGTPHNSTPTVPPYKTSASFSAVSTTTPISTQSPSATTPTSPAPPSSAMAPPGRPEHKPTDLNELGDVLFGVGVDLKEEEAALTRSKGTNNSTGGQEDRTKDPPSASSARYPFSRDNFYSQNRPGERSSFYGAGTLNQRAQPEAVADQSAESERTRAARKQAEIKQYHLNDPFLLSGTLQRRVFREASKLHVQVPVKESDILKPAAPKVAPQAITVQGPDAHDVVKIVQGEPLLLLKNHLVDILSLLSLAAEERLRILVEDAATLAHGRKAGSSGMPPQELADLASTDPSLGLTKKDLDRKNVLSRSYAQSNAFTLPDAKPNSSLRPPSNPVALTLQRISKKERALEEARVAKRQKRAETNNNPSRAGSISLEPSEPGTPTTNQEVAPVDLNFKKSALKNAKKQPSESQQFAASNKAASMALAGAGITGKKRSWMTQDSKPTNPYQQDKQPAKPSAGSGSSASGAKASGARSRVWGGFKEDGPEGAGIQLRDLISVLEFDGKEKKSLQMAYGRLEKEKKTES